MRDQQRKQLLLELLEKNPGLRRKQLVERCISGMGYTPEQQRDRRVNSTVTRAKNRVGLCLTALIENGDISENEAGRLYANHDAGALLEQTQADRFVLGCLKDGAEWSKPQLFHAADQSFSGKDAHALIGQAIARLLRQRRIRESPHGYRLPPKSAYPDSELGAYLLEARNGGDLQKCFLSAVHVHGGEWLEYYAVRLLTEYYCQSGKTVTAAYVTGGSNDGGLDGVIETTDWLGFREKTLMQMKNRYAQISAKDVREFYGAVCADHGSRGVFITVSTFHPEAQKLLDKVDNLIGVDGQKLFEIAKLCRFGIRDRGSGLVLDDDLFLAELHDDEEDTPVSANA